jgi:hypothetical protein
MEKLTSLNGMIMIDSGISGSDLMDEGTGVRTDKQCLFSFN